MRRAAGVLGMALLAGCGGSKGDAAGGADADGGAGGSSSLSDAAGCTLVAQGTSGLAIKATLLVPNGPLDGEVLVDGKGNIACVDTSCSSSPGYASATQIACTSAV